MVTTVIRGREGYEWLELARRRFPPSEEEAASADRARSLGPLTPEQCANLLCIPVPDRQTPDGHTIGAILDVLSRASAGERVRFTHGGRERTMASARTLQRWAEDLGVDAGLITVDVPGEADVVDITVGFATDDAQARIRELARRVLMFGKPCVHVDPLGRHVEIGRGATWIVRRQTKATESDTWTFINLEEALDQYVALAIGDPDETDRFYHPSPAQSVSTTFGNDSVLTYTERSDGCRTVTSIKRWGVIAWEGSVDVPDKGAMIGVREIGNGKAVPTINGVAVRGADHLGYAQRDIAAGEVIAVALGGGSTADATPSACIMPPGWLDASSGAWLDVAAEQFYNIKRDPGEACDALRARLRAEQRARDAAAVEENRDRGTEPWLRRRLGALLGVEPNAFGIESVDTGVVLVTAWQCGVTVSALIAALAKLEEELPLGVRLEAAPVRVTNPVPIVTPGPAVHRSNEPQGIPIATPAEHIDLLDAMARRPSPPADDAERARRFFAGEGERTTRVNQWQGARHFWERGAR